MLIAIFSTLPMFACLFWGVTFCLDFRHNDRAKRFLTLFMLVSALLYLCHTAYFNREYVIFPVTDSIYTFTTLAVYPIYFLYIKLLSESRDLKVYDFLILLPALLFSIAAAAIYMAMSSEERILYIHHWAFGDYGLKDASGIIKMQVIRYKLTSIVFAVQIIPILYLGGKKISHYNQEINNYYSNTEGKIFPRINFLLIAFVITSLVSFAMNIIGKEFFATSSFLILIPSLLFGILLYSLGYFGNKQNFTVADFSGEAKQNDQQNDNISQKEITDKKLSHVIIRLVEEKELFRQPDIKVSDISQMMATNRTYISTAINKELNLTFSEFINTYRIEYAKGLILKAQQENVILNMSSIIEMSGFATESSFYRIFKSITGTTPKKWAKDQRRFKLARQKNPVFDEM